jgi:hypothetical protein
MEEALDEAAKRIESGECDYPTALIIRGLILNRAGKPEEGEGVLRGAVKLREESLRSGRQQPAAGRRRD